MVATVELDQKAPSKISAWHQISFIEPIDAHSETNKDHKFYFGLAQTPCKERFWNHNREFNHRQYIKSTELSKYIWLLKDAGHTSSIGQ